MSTISFCPVLFGAADGSRTHLRSLGSFYSTDELQPQVYSIFCLAFSNVALLFYHKLSQDSSLFFRKAELTNRPPFTLHNLNILISSEFSGNYNIPHFPLSFPQYGAAFSPVSSYFSTRGKNSPVQFRGKVSKQSLYIIFETKCERFLSYKKGAGRRVKNCFPQHLYPAPCLLQLSICQISRVPCRQLPAGLSQ